MRQRLLDYSNINEVFGAMSHSIFLQKLAAQDLDGCTLPGVRLAGSLDPESEWSYTRFVAVLRVQYWCYSCLTSLSMI